MYTDLKQRVCVNDDVNDDIFHFFNCSFKAAKKKYSAVEINVPSSHVSYKQLLSPNPRKKALCSIPGQIYTGQTATVVFYPRGSFTEGSEITPVISIGNCALV